jgi:ribosomal protein L22
MTDDDPKYAFGDDAEDAPDGDPAETAAEEVPAEVAEEPVDEPVAEEPAEDEPAAEDEPVAEDEPAAEDEPVEEPVAEDEPAAEPVAEEEPAEEAAAPKRRSRRGRGAQADAPAEQPKPKPAPSRRRDGDARPVVRAHAKYVRTSARKARLVCDHIRGKSVEEARAILALTPRAVAEDWQKLLESAVANAEHNHELVGDDLKIVAVFADEGPTLKRFRPRAMGRATRIRKRTSHLTIQLTPKD